MTESLPSRTQTTAVYRLLILVGMAALVWLGLDQLRPPPCMMREPPNEFSCQLALARVEGIAYEPHPVGSKSNDEARDYLLNELRMIGLSPTVQSANVADTNGNVWRVNNIVARLPGTTKGRPLMLACHYDSVVPGPGASDDGLAVGALVETMRVLKAGAPLRNDVILLITDGEERGMLGAEAFVLYHPWAREIGLVLNFDARGTDGPSVMFQTSPANADLIKHFASAAPYPVALSMAGDVYKHMPNDTDFTVFSHAGMKGLNFAFIGNYIYYHTAGDNLQHLDRNTLAHTGSYAVALARHFGNIDLAPLASDKQTQNAVYFTAFRRVLVAYDEVWIWPITVVLVIAMVLAISLTFKKGWITSPGVTRSVIRLLIGLVISTAAVWVTGLLVGLVFHRWPDLKTPEAITISNLVFTAITIIVTFAAALPRRRVAGPNDLAAAGAIIWTAIAVVLSAAVPGGSYLAVWPALLALAGFYAMACGRLPTWGRLLIVLLASAPLLVLMSPSLDLFFTALTYRGAYLVAPMMALTLWLLITSGAIQMLGLIKPSAPRPANPN